MSSLNPKVDVRYPSDISQSLREQLKSAADSFIALHIPHSCPETQVIVRMAFAYGAEVALASVVEQRSQRSIAPISPGKPS